MAEPLLSIVFIGRNDGYGGDFLYRLQTALGLWTRHLTRLGRLDEAEALVVDFGGAEPLRRALALPKEAAAWVRFLEPPGDFLRAAAPRGEFPAALAANLGLRRARGRFVMFSDADSLLPAWACARLWEILRGEFPPVRPEAAGLMQVRRYQAPRELAARQPSLGAWERLFTRLPGCQQPEEPSCGCLGGFAAAQILPRALLHAAGGYDEALRGWGWSDNELTLRVCEKHSWTDLGTFGVYGLHLEHGGSAPQPRPRAAVNPMTLRDAVAADWGAPGVKLEPRPPENFAPPVRDWPPLPPTRLARVDWQRLGREPGLASFFTRRLGKTKISRAQRPLVEALLAFSLDGHPRSLVWDGPLEEALAGAALAANPAMEAYFLTPWLAGDATAAAVNPSNFSGLLARQRYKGFAQIIGGARDAEYWRRLDGLLDGALPVELGISTWRGHDPAQEQGWRWLARRLAPGGLWILTGVPDAQTESVPPRLGKLLPPDATVRSLPRSGAVIVLRAAAAAAPAGC